MQRHTFGNTGLQVSAIGLGCARIGGVFQADPASFDRLIAVARDAGINFFDTADMYSQGESESILGRVLQRERSAVIIATKAGYCLPGRRKLAGRLKPFLRPVIRALGIRRDQLPSAARGEMGQDFSADYLTRALEASLRRLRTDYIDVFQLHSPPLAVIERGEWQSALDALKRAGKLRHYGIACDSLAAARSALKISGISSIQFTFSLLEQGAASEILPQSCLQETATIARECLGNGLLVKDTEGLDLTPYCSSVEEVARRVEQLAELRREASERGVLLSRLALDFVSQARGVSVALVGARTPQQLRALLDQVPA